MSGDRSKLSKKGWATGPSLACTSASRERRSTTGGASLESSSDPHEQRSTIQAEHPSKAAQIHLSGEALQAVHPLKADQIHVSGKALQAVHPFGATPLPTQCCVDMYRPGKMADSSGVCWSHHHTAGVGPNIFMGKHFFKPFFSSLLPFL